jgi:hypothetical protein
MAKYDLTGSLEKDFTFSIDDKEFSFRKPTVREMRELTTQFSKMDKEKDPEKQIQLGDEALAVLYSYVTPVGHDVAIADVLADYPLGVQQAFNEMIKKELGASS